MADNVSGKKIKELPLAEDLNDTDDIVIETEADMPVTKRTKWATIVAKLKSVFGIEDIQNKINAMSEIYVENSILYLPSSVASVIDSTLIIGIGGNK